MADDDPLLPLDNLGALLQMARKATSEQVTEAHERQGDTGRRIGTELINVGVDAIEIAKARDRQARLRGERLSSDERLELMRKMLQSVSLSHFRTQQKQTELREIQDRIVGGRKAAT